MKIKRTIEMLAMLATLAIVPWTHGAIGVVNTGSKISSTAGVKTSTLSFNAGASADKVIVQVSSEKSAEAFTVTYNGVELTPASGTSLGRNQGIFYLDSPYTGGAANLTVDMSGVTTVNGIAFGVVSINGSDPGVAVTTNAAANSVTLDVSTNGSFVVAGYAANNNNNVSANAPLTQLYGGQNIGNAVGAAGYSSGVSSGVQTYTFTGGEAGTAAACAAAFTPAPAAPDTTPPSIISLSPADDATGALPSANMVATFDENIALTGSGTIVVTNLDDNSAITIDLSSLPGADADVTVSGVDLTIVLSNSLASSTSYAVLISADAVEDLASTPNAFAGIDTDTNWNFTTEAIVLSSSFDGVVTPSASGPNPTATGITWDTVVGIETPASSLQFNDVSGTAGFYNSVGNTENEICVAENLPVWNTSVGIVVSSKAEQIDLASLDFYWRVANNAGADNSSSSKLDTWTVEIVGSVSGSLGTRSIGPAAPGSPVQFRSIDLSGLSLTPSETYTLTLSIVGTGFGHTASLQDFTLKGSVTMAPPKGTVIVIR